MAVETALKDALVPAFRAGFREREAVAKHLAELVLDAVDAVLPLDRHEPADGPLATLEQLATAADVFSYEGAPGWDVVLAEGLGPRQPSPAGPSVLEGLGASSAREDQRGELKRRVRALAKTLVAEGRAAAQGADAARVVALHAALLRLFGAAAASSALLLPEDPTAGALPKPIDLRAEIASRSGGFAIAHEEWLARLQQDNEATRLPVFRRYFAGLSQCLRAGEALVASEPPLEPILGVVGAFQPVRWAELRGGVPASWIAELCPAGMDDVTGALDVLGRLWSARHLSATGFAALYSLFVARCASVAARIEETRL